MRVIFKKGVEVIIRDGRLVIAEAIRDKGLGPVAGCALGALLLLLLLLLGTSLVMLDRRSPDVHLRLLSSGVLHRGLLRGGVGVRGLVGGRFLPRRAPNCVPRQHPAQSHAKQQCGSEETLWAGPKAGPPAGLKCRTQAHLWRLLPDSIRSTVSSRFFTFFCSHQEVKWQAL